MYIVDEIIRRHLHNNFANLSSFVYMKMNLKMETFEKEDLLSGDFENVALKNSKKKARHENFLYNN